jgi:hypothetical protein
MPEVNDIFTEYGAMELGALHEARNSILSKVPDGNYKQLDDESLSRLLAIGRALRVKTAHSNSGSKKGARAPKTPTATDDLL